MNNPNLGRTITIRIALIVAEYRYHRQEKFSQMVCLTSAQMPVKDYRSLGQQYEYYAYESGNGQAPCTQLQTRWISRRLCFIQESLTVWKRLDGGVWPHATGRNGLATRLRQSACPSEPTYGGHKPAKAG